jgi:hypothetical protein
MQVQSSPAGSAESVRELKRAVPASTPKNDGAASKVADRVELSFEALARLDLADAGLSTNALDEDDKLQLQALKRRDQEVRAHEQAHLAAAGGYAKGGATFSYEKGPDGRLYAVGGEVSIDASEVAGNPQATLQKARTVTRAALAPANPSSADRSVAAKAAAMAAQAQQEIAMDGASSLPDEGDGGTATTQEADNEAGRMSTKEVDE